VLLLYVQWGQTGANPSLQLFCPKSSFRLNLSHTFDRLQPRRALTQSQQTLCTPSSKVEKAPNNDRTLI
jgi:hypothetical protein